MEIVLISVIVAIAASIGGLIAMFTKKEMEQYDKWINYSELIVSLILAILMITLYQTWTILFLIIGASFVMLANKFLFHIHLSRYLRMLMFGLALGILFSINRETAFIFGTIVAIHNIIKGSRVGAYFIPKRKNIFKKIGNFQAIFILAALAGFYMITLPIYQAMTLNFAAGAVIATVFGTKI